MKRLFGSAVAIALCVASVSAAAAPILFVSPYGNNLSIATVLTSAGHTVTSSVGSNGNWFNTVALPDALSSYSAIYWSAHGEADASAFDSLTAYVNGGGRVFVTGYDSIFSANMRNFVVGNPNSAHVDTCGIPGKIKDVSNSLTTGVIDIRGATPGTSGTQTCDRDGIILSTDAVGIVEDASYPSYYQWTLRNLGLGQIAYVSNGNYYQHVESSMWSSNSPYQAAVLNFAFNAQATEVPEPSSIALMGLALAGLAFSRRRKS